MTNSATDFFLDDGAAGTTSFLLLLKMMKRFNERW